MFFLPKIYKNELLYSVLARYHENSGNISYIHTIEDVFGDRNGVATVALPSRIRNLVENLMDYQEDFAMELINENTLLNFYAAFKSEEIYTEVMQDMIERIGIGTHMKLGLVSSSTQLDRYLKFCPKCVREDYAIHGEAFWHREHQVFGAKVCYLHRELLHSSKFPVFGRNRQIYYCITPEVCESINENLYDSIKFDIDLLQKIASEINELCSCKLTLTLPDFKNRVRALLYDKGYVKPNNYTNLKGLIEDIRKYYTDELLNFIGCSIVKKNWVVQILNPTRGVGQPMEVLLLLIFLDCSVKKFREMENMENINIKKYIQEGWDKELIQLLDKDFSQREICRLLSSNRKTVLKAMERLNVRKDWNSTGGSRYRGIEYVMTDEYRVIEMKMKESWIELHGMYPNLSSHQIRKKNDHVYAWLKKYQSDWLNDNYRLASVDCAKVDWETRDIELSYKIKAIISQFKSTIGNRITWATIGGELGIGGWLYRKRERLPRCKAIMDKNLETLQQYHLRVLRIAAYELSESEVTISKNALLQYAGVKERFVSKLIKMFNEEDMKIGLSCLV